MSVTEKTIGTESMEKLLADLAGITVSQSVDGFTAAELSHRLGLGIKATRDKIARGIATGLIALAGRRRITRIDGQAGWAPVYRRVAPSTRRHRTAVKETIS